MWIHTRGFLCQIKAGELVLNNHFEGISYAIKNAAMMVTMTEKDDIGVILSNNALIPEQKEDERYPYLFMISMKAVLVMLRKFMI